MYKNNKEGFIGGVYEKPQRYENRLGRYNAVYDIAEGKEILIEANCNSICPKRKSGRIGHYNVYLREKDDITLIAGYVKTQEEALNKMNEYRKKAKA